MNLLAILLIALIVANALKKNIKLVRHSLIPTPVLGGIILLIVSGIYEAVSGNMLFNTGFFGENGLSGLEIITYHFLALGFIASTLKRSENKFTGKRKAEIFDSGVTTVASYLVQGILGLGATIIIAFFILPTFFPAAGILLPFGFGQGSGQALNYGSIYESDYGFVGGRNFGLTVAALGFIAASIGGVIHLNLLKKKGVVIIKDAENMDTPKEQIETPNEIPMNGTIDKLTVQIAFTFGVYGITYLVMYLLGELVPGLISVIYGFNFLLGVLVASGCRVVMNLLRKKGIVNKRYTNNFFLTHLSNFFFDVMIVAGIAAIRLEALAGYWWILLVLGVVGTISTYFYNRFIAKKFFPNYAEEQFLVMYGMLTGTASTGIMLLREIDPDYKTPAQENLIYQTLPAIVFGFPMMIIATLAPKEPVLTLIVLAAFFLVMNIILFRRQIFRFKKKTSK